MPGFPSFRFPSSLVREGNPEYRFGLLARARARSREITGKIDVDSDRSRSRTRRKASSKVFTRDRILLEDLSETFARTWIDGVTGEPPEVVVVARDRIGSRDENVKLK